jgi:hypothetical protein
MKPPFIRQCLHCKQAMQCRDICCLAAVGFRGIFVAGKQGGLAVLSAADGSVTVQHAHLCESVTVCRGVPGGHILALGGAGVLLVDSASLAPVTTLSGHKVRLKDQSARIVAVRGLSYQALHSFAAYGTKRWAWLQELVQALAATQDGAYLATAANSDPVVAFFKLAQNNGEKRRRRRARGHAQLAHPAVSLECCAAAAKEGGPSEHAFLLLAVTTAGTAEVWRCERAGKGLEAQRRCTVRVDSAGQAEAGIFSASFEGSDGAVLLLTHH